MSIFSSQTSAVTEAYSALKRSATTAKSTAGSKVRGYGSNATAGLGVLNGSSNAADSSNPYTLFYLPSRGYIFGRPFAYLPRSDPNQRVFQKTILRNNTLINIVPGVPYQDKELLEKAREILSEADKQFQAYSTSISDPIERNQKLNKLGVDTQDALIKNNCDLRYAVFKQDITAFMKAFQIVLNRVGTAILGMSGGIGRFVTDDIASFNISEDAAARGFKVWVEKGTSISETIDNAYMRSVLENAQKAVSGVVKQAKFLGTGVGFNNGGDNNTEIVSSNADAQQSGQAANVASRTVSGAVYDFPQIFDSSSFNRSYQISFKFTSPYGDDRSVLNNVIIPFLFLFTCAAPRQDGPTGHTSPFLLQIDAPGLFSCPMGVASNFSFKKGGDDMLFNDRGLPLVIEGTMNVMDLYSNLSLPLSYGQFSTNFGISAFLNTLGGLNLYASVDMSLSDRSINFAKDLITRPLYAVNKAKEEIYSLQRFFGI